MRLPVYGLCVVAVLGVTACGSSSSSSGMSEQDSVVAAAHLAAQDMSSTLDIADMDNSGDSGGAAGTGYRAAAASGEGGYRVFSAPNCISGSFEDGSETVVDVGSPYTGDMDIDWEHFQGCEQDTPALTDGYKAIAVETDGDDEYRYTKIIGELSHPYAASDFDGDGFVVEGSFLGDWNLAMLRYQRIEFPFDTPAVWEEEAYIDWLMEIPLDDAGNDTAVVHMIMGSGPAPNERMQMMTDVTTDPVTREINGYAAMTVTGDGQDCAFAVTYETVETLEIGYEGFPPQDVVENGQLDVDVEGGGAYSVTWDDRDMFVDGEPVDPANLPEQCEFVMGMED